MKKVLAVLWFNGLPDAQHMMAQAVGARLGLLDRDQLELEFASDLEEARQRHSAVDFVLIFFHDKWKREKEDPESVCALEYIRELRDNGVSFGLFFKVGDYPANEMADAAVFCADVSHVVEELGKTLGV